MNNSPVALTNLPSFLFQLCCVYGPYLCFRWPLVLVFYLFSIGCFSNVARIPYTHCTNTTQPRNSQSPYHTSWSLFATLLYALCFCFYLTGLKQEDSIKQTFHELNHLVSVSVSAHVDYFAIVCACLLNWSWNSNRVSKVLTHWFDFITKIRSNRQS